MKTQATPNIFGIGDTMLEVIMKDGSASGYDRTVLLQREALPVGGAICNFYWYLTQLGRVLSVATHYGSYDTQRMSALLAGDTGRFRAEKTSETDVLIVLPDLQVASLYILGKLSCDDSAKMLAGITDGGVVAFVGSRHQSLRAAYLERVRALTQAIVVFSPSYTVYEYSASELRDFLTHSHLTFVNKHEIAHMCKTLGVQDPADVMKSNKLGGVVTHGPDGAWLYPHNGPPHHCPSVSGLKEDVIGAGEAFMCGFLHSYLSGGAWEVAGTFGCAIAAQVVRDGRVRAPIDAAMACGPQGSINQSALPAGGSP